jgi:sec-independent protein translocase protein TatB
MLPSLGFNEIIILGILALVVVGPKDLPLLFRKLGKWTAKLRGMAQEFRTGFDELARQAELDELKREVQALRRTTNLGELAREITKPLPTLEDYAGISKPLPTPAVPERIASSSMEEAPRSGGGGARAEGEGEPPVGARRRQRVSPPQSSLRDDSSSIEEERKALDVPEHADAAPIARSAP